MEAGDSRETELHEALNRATLRRIQRHVQDREFEEALFCVKAILHHHHDYYSMTGRHLDRINGVTMEKEDARDDFLTALFIDLLRDFRSSGAPVPGSLVLPGKRPQGVVRREELLEFERFAFRYAPSPMRARLLHRQIIHLSLRFAFQHEDDLLFPFSSVRENLKRGIVLGYRISSIPEDDRHEEHDWLVVKLLGLGGTEDELDDADSDTSGHLEGCDTCRKLTRALIDSQYQVEIPLLGTGEQDAQQFANELATWFTSASPSTAPSLADFDAVVVQATAQLLSMTPDSYLRRLERDWGDEDFRRLLA